MKVFPMRHLRLIMLLFLMTVSTHTSCDLLHDDLSDEDRVVYLLKSVWTDELSGSLNDTMSYIAFQTLEFDSERFYLESSAAVYYSGINPDTALSFRYMTGRIRISEIDFVNDSSASGRINFSDAYVDPQFSQGLFTLIDSTQLHADHSAFSVYFRKTDSLITEKYLDRNGIIKTDTLHISGVGRLIVDDWYDSPQASHFTAFLYKQRKF